jgi:hypothetical protein
MNDAPDKDPSSKPGLELAMSSEISEAARRIRQQRTDMLAAATRAERSTRQVVDRLRWIPALKATWVKDADLSHLGLAWGAARRWAEADPSAERAASNVESRLSTMAPESMAHFDELRRNGASRAEAMRGVAADITAEFRRRRTGLVRQLHSIRTAVDGSAVAAHQSRHAVPDGAFGGQVSSAR